MKKFFVLIVLLSGCATTTTLKWVDVRPDHDFIGACATYINGTLYISTPDFCMKTVQEMREEKMHRGEDPGPAMDLNL